MPKVLKMKRVEADLTQEELSKKAGVSRATICAIEAGASRKVNIETLRKLAKALNCKMSDFFADEI